ncbi:serine protease [Methyloprofundus sedimenti]|uniref:Serine protease n=1 Tax=Methyloprofundus sedimenti TaxID=1420851 RepID=A0A1V8M668_9GAMM|nr:patatin-like phospholipase family protein [Methyloprofundus sedimenti]OQK16883.1 serine protease [Methyloprofundus sedimenti]
MKSVSLVLGSGGARGLAHIGVIHWLEEHNYRIQSISGCSMGALIGGIYAAGKLDEFEKWVRAITKLEIITLLDISWNKSGLVKGDKIINTLIDLVGDMKIEDLPIKYTAVAADVNEEKEIWINSGRLFDAIRASISLPMLFTPHYYMGAHLIDGGVLNPVPIAPTFSDNTDITLAVNLGGKLISNSNAIDINDHQKKKNNDGINEKINNYIQQLKNKIDLPQEIDWGAYEIANQAFDAMQSTIARQKLAAYPPDRSIEIARNACGTLEFDRADEMITLGYRKAQESFT